NNSINLLANNSINLSIDQDNNNGNSNIIEDNNAILEVDIDTLSQIIDEITKTENTKEFEIIVQFGILNLPLSETTKFICEQIENGNGYKWKKPSNRKRIIQHNCNRQLIILTNLLKSYANIKIQHEIVHERPSILEKVLEEIKSFFTRSLYQQHEDPVKSAIVFIENKYQLTNYELKNAKEIHLDAIYKMAKGNFELYGLIAEKSGTGFALGYLILETKRGEVDDDENQTMSEEEFWNPKQKNNYVSSTDIEHVDVTDRQRLKSKHHEDKEDDDETSMQDDIYIIHSRDSSPTINDNDEAVQKNINEIETNNEHYETIDDGTDNEDNFIPSKVVNEQIKPQKFADGQWDEEIRSLLQLVGEAIFRQFQRQDSTLFQSSENAIIQSETKLTQSLEKQFER
ncbi:1048_t:CDS:2, partial [Gigaspora rosea]